jgi:serine/threonine-protein kinase
VPTAVLPLPQVGAVLAPADASAGTGRRALVRAALGGLAALVLLAVVIGVLQHSGGSAGPASARSGAATTAGVAVTSTSPVPTTSTAPRTVHLTAADYLRHPVAQVRAALAALGLQVTLTPVTTGAFGAGQVTAVAPVGDVPTGSSVTVSYAVTPIVAPAPQPAPQPAPAPGPKHKKHGKGGD